ncbi:NAD(P)-dependent oxidoreductase [Paracoccus sp. (in: a-proteobacteria)]|uniref:NAD(P)-dependent oxidoreductase n=1 Tax=Paracoccus sp. TaxID=267 RepID=UPI002AFF3584|nr:NAD(P)-dependent oxidoreductase [Paracoccus sp. (in: a-proteobacteria)]
MAFGYIGVGNMGGAVARRIQRVEPLVVYDLSAEALARMADAGATVAGSVSELAQACDVIFLCLPTSDHVRGVLFDEGGLAASARPGTLIIDQTSGDPTATREMASILAETGIEMVDAPLSGGLKGAEEGTVAIMVGGSEAQFARIHPLLEAIGPNVFHAGPLGAGNAVKLANDLVSAAHRLISFRGAGIGGQARRRAKARDGDLHGRLGPEFLHGALLGARYRRWRPAFPASASR